MILEEELGRTSYVLEHIHVQNAMLSHVLYAPIGRVGSAYAPSCIFLLSGTIWTRSASQYLEEARGLQGFGFFDSEMMSFSKCP